MANMKEIAKQAGVGTVSHVLNNTARVRESIRQRVLDAVRTSGYQRSELARGLRRDKTKHDRYDHSRHHKPIFPCSGAGRRRPRIFKRLSADSV